MKYLADAIVLCHVLNEKLDRLISEIVVRFSWIRFNKSLPAHKIQYLDGLIQQGA